MELTETILTPFISGLFGVILGYMAFRVKLESRLKDLEHQIELLEPFKKILYKVGLERAEKVFREGDK